MKKLSLSLMFAFAILGILATSAFANGTVNPTGGHNEIIDPAGDVGRLNPNANGTGSGINNPNAFRDVIKSQGMIDNHGQLGDQKTHTSYQNNTNSCASCHQTHTAKARNLLFADSSYQTCSACHDGTLGFYNVFANGSKAGTAGTFGGTHSGNMSVHLANGAVKIKAAPGGNANGTGSWDGQFTCASCHAPHGSYSDRLLHYNPNNMGLTTPDQGGILASRIDVVDFANLNGGVSVSSDKFRAVRGTKTQHALSGTAYESIPANAVIIMVYEKNAGSTAYTKTTNPWLYGYTTTANGRDYYSRLFTVTKNEIDTIINWSQGFGTIRNFNAAQNFTNAVIDQNDYLNGSGIVSFKYDKGLVYAYPKTNADGTVDTRGVDLLNNAKSGHIGRAYAVKLDLQPVPGALSNVVTKHNVSALWGSGGSGVAVSQWCTTCHTDYLYSSSGGSTISGSRTSLHGNYNGQEYFGHTTSSAGYTCLRCHYAHGTDVEIMIDANGDNIRDLQKSVDLGGKGWTREIAVAYMKDKNPSSALKKATNMTGCWACHNSSKAGSLKNTNRDPQHPNGMMPDPSTKNEQQPIALGKVTFSTAVNFRTEPSMSAPLIGTIAPNTFVDIYGESDETFYLIYHNNTLGYVAKHAITKQ
ncbi:SH3 domain-containing protein [Anaerobacillus alkaliphilus]|nr:SH3 domain-containing protein [Anaerobacillus alkaliphilus]